MVNENMVPGTYEWKQTKRWYAHQASKFSSGGIMAEFALKELVEMRKKEKAEGFK